MEKAIAAFSAALEVRTRTALPVDWAKTQNNLGAAYFERIIGERAENLEKAITAFSAALEVRTRTALPVDWATTQNNLGNAYRNRIIGERAENLEKAISALTSALEVLTRSIFPVDWARTQNNLGIAYRNRILGEKAKNLENAITAFTSVLEVLTRSAFPELWAQAQSNLGNAYFDRILGERAKNLENAIAAYTAALEVFTRSAFPFYWANTQSNLGNAYSEKILGERAENVEKAIAAYTAALEVYTRSAFPELWARTQHNLGNAYRNTILGENAENLENQIAAYTAALEIYTRSAFPQQWATTQNNLGSAYANRILGDKAENFENAIAAYTAALEVYTHSAFPVDCARTQNNLGLAYCERIRGERAENMKKAIAACSAALKVRTFDAFPQEYAKTLWIQGAAYRYTNQFDLAYSNFKSAIDTIESLREEIVSGEESKRKQAEEWNKFYSSMIEVCLELGNITAAIEYVERSKTRNLVEQILERDSKTIFLPDVVTQLETYRDEIAAGQSQIQNGKAENPKILAQHLQELRQQRNELQNRYLPVGYGFKFDSFQATLDERTAIIEWYLINEKILTFIVTSTGEVTVWQSQPEDLYALINCTNEYLADYYNLKDEYKVQWQNQLEERLKKLAQILHFEELLDKVPKQCNRLILIPHRYLHLLPLHALPVWESYLLDLFPEGVGYAPSCQILQQVQLRQRRDFKSLFAIQNPTEDLNYADLEVESILPLFSSHQVLPNSQATKAALSKAKPQLNEVNSLHFSCHGSFNPNSPLDSCLVLANPYISSDKKALDLNKCLTLGNLFERDFELNQCRLVVLSACETGLIDSNNTSDEYIGLPSGFLYAGSVGVVNSLWTVDDLSTSFLIVKFLQNFQTALTANQDISIASALKEAQLWLRNATKENLQEWAGTLQLDSTWNRNISRYLNKIEDGEQPFQSPYHWAAFTAVGK